MPWQSLSFDSSTPEQPGPYRRPSQARGEAKFEKMLDAAHTLIDEQGVDQFSLTDVATKAGVASSSAYHFFPNLEALFVALVERYDLVFSKIVGEGIDPAASSSWQDILDIQFENARRYINSNPPALILIIGPGRTWQSKQADTIGDSNIANSMVETLERFFILPEFPPPGQLIHFGIRILEGIWELSVQQHGNVTDEFSRETTRAVIAYMRLYWPEHLDRRKPYLASSDES
jgi:AcrR family transcriptional regulator